MTDSPAMIGARVLPRQRILIDGREIPGVISADPERCLALVVETDRLGRPIGDGKGGFVMTRRAGKIEVVGR